MNEIKELFANNSNTIIYKTFDYSLYPSYFNININAGEYAWKPIIFYNECKINRGIVIWMDSGNIINNQINVLVDCIKQSHIHSGVTSGDILKWTHPLTLKYMNCSNDYLKLQNRNGACIGVNYDMTWVQDFVEEWCNCAKINECIAPTGSNRTNHRQDQSILSILYYKYLAKYKFNDKKNEHWKYFTGYSIHNDVD